MKTMPGVDQYQLESTLGALECHVSSGGSLERLVVRGGLTDAEGGGILTEGQLNMTACTVEGNEAWDHPGGGIYNRGTLRLTDCLVQGNEAKDGGNITDFDIFIEGGGICTPTADRTQRLPRPQPCCAPCCALLTVSRSPPRPRRRQRVQPVPRRHDRRAQHRRVRRRPLE